MSPHNSLTRRPAPLLYGAGLRVRELCGLTYGGVDFSAGSARILGKGGKERVCPLGEVCMAVLKRWRENYAPDTSAHAWVVTGAAGRKVAPREVQLLLKRYLQLAELPAVMPRICLTRGQTYVWCRNFWGTPIYRPRKFTPM